MCVLVICIVALFGYTDGGFVFFFLSCKANARIKDGARPAFFLIRYVCFLSLLVFSMLLVLFYVLFVCKYVLYYCHRVSTQLQLKNISYHNTEND